MHAPTIFIKPNLLIRLSYTNAQRKPGAHEGLPYKFSLTFPHTVVTGLVTVTT